MGKNTYVVTADQKTVWIDTSLTFDAGWETMVFSCDRNGKVTDWGELDVDHYYDEVEAMEGHDRMVAKWGTPFEPNKEGGNNKTTEYGTEDKATNDKNDKENTKMTKRQYAEQVAQAVNGTVNEVDKANGVVLTAVCPEVEGNTKPNIYIDKMYEDDMTVEEAVEKVRAIMDEVKDNPINNIDVDAIGEFEKIKTQLRARLYNNRTKAEVYRPAAEYGFDDLIIVPYIELNVAKEGMYSVKVTERMLTLWNVSKETVINTAINNTREAGYEFKSMFEVLMEMMCVPEEDREMMATMMGGDNGMYVMSNKSRAYGAISVALFTDMLKEKFPEGYIVIPSSVHEVIIIPKDVSTTTKDLNSMVNEVNGTQVSPEERLGDKVYIF